MTEIERKALELCNEVQAERNHAGSPWNSPTILNEALYRAIEQHEAFRQQVSDAVEHFKRCYPGYQHASLFDRFIIAKPDPLVEVLADMGLKPKGGYDWASEFRNTLANRGGKIVWEQDQ